LTQLAIKRKFWHAPRTGTGEASPSTRRAAARA
jgi:hypothetical protein